MLEKFHSTKSCVLGGFGAHKMGSETQVCRVFSGAKPWVSPPLFSVDPRFVFFGNREPVGEKTYPIYGEEIYDDLLNN